MKSLGSQVAAVSFRGQLPISRTSAALLTPHMCELLTASFQVTPVLGLHRVLDSARDWIIHAQDRALHQLHLSRSISPQVVGIHGRCLPLSPCFRRAGVAPLIWRRSPAGYSICRCRIFKCCARIMIVRSILTAVSRWCAVIFDVRLRQGVS